MSETILQVDHLDKNFGSKSVLKDVSLSVTKGHVVGLVGPNGAGKTTIMQAILGLFNYQNGQITINGHHVSATSHKAMAKVGALIEYPEIYPFLSGKQHLMLFSNGNKAAVKKVVDEFKMGNYIDRKAKSYSLGMKQKLGIALSLINDPELVILDEPMNGLDPQSNRDLRNTILELAKSGTSFLISSHILSELEKLVDDVVVIDKGKIVAQASMDNFESGGNKLLVLKTSNDVKAKTVLTEKGYKLTDDSKLTIIEDGDVKMAQVIKTLSDNEIDINDIQHVHNDLETSLLDLLKNDKVKEEA